MKKQIEFYIDNHAHDCEIRKKAPKHPFLPSYDCYHQRFVVMFNFRFIIITFNSCWHEYRKPHESICEILNETIKGLKNKPKHSLIESSYSLQEKFKKLNSDNYLKNKIYNVHYIYGSAVKDYALVSQSNYLERFVNESDLLAEAYSDFLEYVNKTFADNAWEKEKLINQLNTLAIYNPTIANNTQLVIKKVDEIIKQLKLEINGNN